MPSPLIKLCMRFCKILNQIVCLHQQMEYHVPKINVSKCTSALIEEESVQFVTIKTLNGDFDLPSNISSNYENTLSLDCIYDIIFAIGGKGDITM